jgi:sporulation protein YlmC with PRC-barrel domain
MLRRASRLGGAAVDGVDGPIGKIDDLLIDEASWRVRQLLVTSGVGTVAVPPRFFGPGAAESGPFSIVSTLQDAPGKQSGAADRQSGAASVAYSDLGVVLGQLSCGNPHGTGFLFPPQGADDGTTRRGRDILGHKLRDEGGVIGTIEDLLIDGDDWTVHYLVVAAGEALGHRLLLLSPRWISNRDWARGTIETRLAREAMAKSPAYDPDVPRGRNDEIRLHAHYGQWGYWR